MCKVIKHQLMMDWRKNFMKLSGMKWNVFLKSLKQAKEKGQLNITQSLAVTKLVERKDRDKRYIKNWRPISLLNVDTKIIPKNLAAKLKKTLPTTISSNQTAYVNKRCSSQSWRLISDIIQVCEKQNIRGYLVTMDIEKVFDSLDHDSNSQQSCVINGGNATLYFNLERGAHQGDPLSAYFSYLSFRSSFCFY